MTTFSFYVIVWFVLMLLAILNGALRVSTYGKMMPEIRGHQLSCFTGILIIGLAIWIIHNIKPLESEEQALMVGFIWILMTVAFEFFFGHFVMKHSWKKLLFEYRIDKGRLWILVLFWVFVGPYVIFSLTS